MATINGTAGNDIIRTPAAGGSLGGLPNATNAGDTINGLGGDDTIIAGDGLDIISGGLGADTLNGGAGNDTFNATLAELAGDVIDGGPGTDTLFVSTASAVLDLSALVFSNLETLRLAGNNTLIMTRAQLNALTLIDGFSTVATNSTLSIADAGAIDLTGKLARISTVNGSSGNDTITADVGTLNGGDADDVLTGSTSANVLHGGDGNDTLNGLSNNDTLDGGAGDDRLNGGFGADTMRGGPGDDVYLLGLGQFDQGAGDTLVELPGAIGTDTLYYTVSDGGGNIDTAAITITIANAPPVAGDDAYQITNLSHAKDPAPGLLRNDTDPDGHALRVDAIVQAPAHGTLTWAPNGKFDYVPLPTFVGTDTFVYRVSDGYGGFDTGTVTITVLPAVPPPPAPPGPLPAPPLATILADPHLVTLDGLA
jgi:hypothetical protein